MQRRDLLRKIGLGVFMLPAMAGTLSAEPKPETGEWYVGGGPQCPDCGMVMDCSWRDEEKKRVVFMHPAEHPVIRGDIAMMKPWPCKNAGRKFYYPTQQVEEYHGEMKRNW